MKRSESTRIENISYIHAGVGVSYIESLNNFFVSGTNSKGQLGTKDFFDRYYLTSIQSNVCTPMCSGLTLGGTIEFCTPFIETIETYISPDDYTFKWFKNNELIMGETNEFIEIQTIGTYSVIAEDKSGSCLPQTSSITVREKQKQFEFIHNSYCLGNLEFKVVGEGDFTWQSSKTGFTIGTGNYISVSKFFTEEIIADSVYQVWLTHEDNCQAMPLQIIKNCNCNSITPIAIDTTACTNRDFFVRALGDSIIWYTNANIEIPVHIGPIYHPQIENEGTHILYATNITNRCESIADSSILALQNCISWAEISGTVSQSQTPTQYARVLLLKKNEQTPLDSSITDQFGFFKLLLTPPILLRYLLSLLMCTI